VILATSLLRPFTSVVSLLEGKQMVGGTRTAMVQRELGAAL
jgi:hypothetical protein